MHSIHQRPFNYLSLITEVFLSCLALFLSWLVFFPFRSFSAYLQALFHPVIYTSLMLIPAHLIFYKLFQLFHHTENLNRLSELFKILAADSTALLFTAACLFFFRRKLPAFSLFPQPVLISYFVINAAFVIGVRSGLDSYHQKRNQKLEIPR